MAESPHGEHFFCQKKKNWLLPLGIPVNSSEEFKNWVTVRSIGKGGLVGLSEQSHLKVRERKKKEPNYSVQASRQWLRLRIRKYLDCVMLFEWEKGAEYPQNDDLVRYDEFEFLLAFQVKMSRRQWGMSPAA